MKKLVIYHNKIPEIGGIETAITNLLKKLRGYKVIIIFDEFIGNGSKLLLKWAEYADVKQRERGKVIECDICLNASNHVIPSEIKAGDYFQWVHADYEKYELALVKNPQVQKYVCVSNHVAKVCERKFGVETVVIPNIIDDDMTLPSQKMIRLVTNCRISTEKGFGRMLKLAQMFKDAGIAFVWDIYGTTTWVQYFNEVRKMFAKFPEVVFRGVTSDVKGVLVYADYLVQLSDHEGFCYAVAEALQMKVPCIVTDLETLHELVEEGVNGYFVPLSMKGIDVKKFLNIPNNFIFYPKGNIQQWEKLFAK